MSQPRASTDEERAPLLVNHDHEHDDDQPRSFFGALLHPTRPLTNLEKMLAALGVILLLLMSTFVGLFIGSQATLKKERGKEGGVHWSTTTQVATTTITPSSTTAGGSAPTAKPNPKADICTTTECVLLASDILRDLDTSVDPCEDFYQFAVGGWVATHDIPADRGTYGSFNAVNDNNKKVISKILDAIPDKIPSSPSIEDANLHKLKSVYSSCIDTDALNELGITPLSPLIKDLIDLIGPFDLIPAPDAESSFEYTFDASAEWKDTWHESYQLPADLVDAAERVERLQKAKQTAAHPWERRQSGQVTIEGERDAIVESGAAKERKEKITQTLAWLHSRGVEGLVNFAIEGDAGGEDSQVQSLWLYQASGGLPSKEYYEEKPILDLYQSVVQGVLTEVVTHVKSAAKRDMLEDWIEEMVETETSGWPWPWPGDDGKGGEDKTPGGGKKGKDEPVGTRMERLAAKVVEFERELVRAGADPEYLFNPHFSYNPYATERVEKALPFLDIPLYLSTYAPRSFPANITVTHPPYLKSVTRLVETTPDYVLSAYFTTRLALTYASTLGPKVGLRQETRRLEEVLRGLKKGTEENRQDVCLGWVDNIIGFIAGHEFVRESFSPEAKEDGEHIIKSIVKAFHDKLPHISWMDKESAEAAQKKANGIIPKVGYPLSPNSTDPASLASWYGRVEIKADDFFGNVLRSTLADEARVWGSLGRKRDRNTWDMYPQTVNAYYSPPDGEIVFPAGILQPPFYSYEWPSHLKYGAFGAVAAHELTHAFDNTGAQYDDHGRLRDWWTNSTIHAFEERAQCVAKQYSKYYVLDAEGKKVYVNGNLTNGEDIADSGLAQAYLAWKNDLKSSAKPLHLPGLDYTEEQLFFIAYSRVWASLSRPATAVARVRTDPHSPNYWRATGTLRNLDKFHEAFGCKVGSGMRPRKDEQCDLW